MQRAKSILIKTPLHVIQEEPFEMNTEQDELELKAFEERQQKEHRDLINQSQHSIDLTCDDNQLLNDKKRKPIRQNNLEPEYFYVYTPTGPVKCKNHTRSKAREDLLQLKEEPEYFYVNTPEGPVKCKRYVRRNVSEDRLKLSEEIDSTLFCLENEHSKNKKR